MVLAAIALQKQPAGPVKGGRKQMPGGNALPARGGQPRRAEEPCRAAAIAPTVAPARQEDAMPETNDIFEVMSTMRAMRRLKPDPVPDELINKILQAGQWAPSGGNTQRWRFLVVKDPEVKKKVQVYYKRLYDETVGPRYASSPPPPGSDPARYQRQHAAVKYLTDRLRERSRRDFRVAAGRPFLRDPADRLADGSVRSVRTRAAQGCRLSR